MTVRAGARALVVDDDESNRLLLQVILELAGIEQVRLDAGTVSLGPVVAEFDPDVLLLDLHLGEVHGFDVLRELASTDPGWGRRRTVLLTGETSAAVREEALALGAAAVVTKPYDTDALVALVEQLLAD